MSSEQILQFLEMYTSGKNFRNPIEVYHFADIIRKHFNKFTSFKYDFNQHEILLTRARKHNSPRTLFPNLSDLWYPPKEYVDVSRGNLPNNPVFYCSNDPGTSIFEVRPELFDWVTSIEVEVNVPLLELLVMGGEFDNLNIDKTKLSNIDIGLNKFLEKKFREEISHNAKHLYYITALFVDAFIKTKHGIIYPSMASNLKGWNIALEKKIADESLIFKRAIVHEITEMTSKYDFKVKCLYTANYLNQYEDFIWERVTDCPTHHITEKIYDK